MRSPRSVAEILPTSFESLSIADVGDMLDGMGDERETLFVALKREAVASGAVEELRGVAAAGPVSAAATHFVAAQGS